MNRPQLFDMLRSWLLRGWLLYLAIALAAWFLVDAKRMSSHARPTTLSRLRPNYGYIAKFDLDMASFDRKSLEDQRVYLENVITVMGERPDTYSLLGYVYYHLGDKLRSEKAFAKAAELNPSFFWNYFNMALLALANGDQGKAEAFLGKAVLLDPQSSAQFILSSRVFLPLVLEGGFTPPMFMERLLQGRADAYKLLAQIELSSNRFDSAISFAQSGIMAALLPADQAVCLYYLGASAVQTGAFPMALKAFEESLKIEPENPEALLGMGMILKSIGKVDEASVFFQKAGELGQRGVSRIPKVSDFKLRTF